jgi:hypothetical protein
LILRHVKKTLRSMKEILRTTKLSSFARSSCFDTK